MKESAAKHFEGLAALSACSAGQWAAVKAGCKPVHFSLTVARCPATFPGVWPQLRDTLSTSWSMGRRTGAFIYALSADENRPALTAPRHTSTARYSSSLLRSLCGSASLGFSSRASTFWRRVSYSRSSRWGLPIFRLQGGPPGGESVHLGPEPFGGGQGYSVQAFQLSCRRLKQDDFALMPPEELLLVPGLAVFLIQGTELAIGGGVLHSEGQPLHFFLRCPEVRLHPGGGGRRPVAPLGQVLQTSDAMLRQEVQRFPPPASSSRWLPNACNRRSVGP